MKRSKFTDSQIMEALKRSEAGLAVPDLCRELGISVPTFYKWRAKFGGMDASLISKMKELEEENRHRWSKFNRRQQTRISLAVNEIGNQDGMAGGLRLI